jgi:hypothetical protein
MLSTVAFAVNTKVIASPALHENDPIIPGRRCCPERMNCVIFDTHFEKEMIFNPDGDLGVFF